MFAVNSDEKHKLYRITSSIDVFLDDTEDGIEKTDFYNFDVQLLRYRAFTIQPGNLDDANDAFNYNKVKLTVVDLRN